MTSRNRSKKVSRTINPSTKWVSINAIPLFIVLIYFSVFYSTRVIVIIKNTSRYAFVFVCYCKEMNTWVCCIWVSWWWNEYLGICIYVLWWKYEYKGVLYLCVIMPKWVRWYFVFVGHDEDRSACKVCSHVDADTIHIHTMFNRILQIYTQQTSHQRQYCWRCWHGTWFTSVSIHLHKNNLLPLISCYNYN